MSFHQTLRYLLLTALAVFLTFFLHEQCHWLAGTMLGYEMRMTWNSAYPVTGRYLSEHDEMLISAAGPAFTLLQAFIFYGILRKRRHMLLYPFLFVPLYMRMLAGVMNVISLNDEGRISRYLGWGTFTLSAIVCILLLYLVIDISRRNRYANRLQLVTVLLTLLFSSALILLDPVVHH